MRQIIGRAAANRAGARPTVLLVTKTLRTMLRRLARERVPTSAGEVARS